MLRRALTLGLLATLLPAMQMSTGASPGVTTPAGNCALPAGALTRADLPEGASVVACAAVGRRLVLGDGAGVEVPPPGKGVTVSLFGVDAASSRLASVVVSTDGRIRYESPQAAPAVTSTSTGTSPAACEDGTYGLMSFKWYTRMDWWWNDGSKPANLSTTETLEALRDGGRNIVTANNDCGLVDDISADMAYRGTTNDPVDMYTVDGVVYCDAGGSTNGLSTVGFSGMPSGYLGATCTWRIDRSPEVNEATETDIRINLNKRWTVTPLSASCDQQYDLEYVVTHERGHSFGLADLAGDHEWLTMYEAGRTCSRAGRTLGLGDVRGLRQRY